MYFSPPDKQMILEKGVYSGAISRKERRAAVKETCYAPHISFGLICLLLVWKWQLRDYGLHYILCLVVECLY